jgi:phosphoribosylglycinamide formyltransferase-1
MVEQSRTDPPILDADVVGVISNHPKGGTFTRSNKLKVPFDYWPGPFTAEGYQGWVGGYRADYVMLSGWLKPVEGLDPATTINIHPGPLNYENPELHFGGTGMHGDHVHEAVLEAYKKGVIKQSAVTMHFVTPYSKDGYDRGPIIVRWPVPIREDDDLKSLRTRVNERERVLQSYILNLVVNGWIYLREGEVIALCVMPLLNACVRMV